MVPHVKATMCGGYMHHPYKSCFITQCSKAVPSQTLQYDMVVNEHFEQLNKFICMAHLNSAESPWWPFKSCNRSSCCIWHVQIQLFPIRIDSAVYRSVSYIITIHGRPVQLARPTSGTIQLEPRTCPHCPQYVLRTCLAISQLPLDPEKGMTHQFISTFHGRTISFVRIKVWCLIME